MLGDKAWLTAGVPDHPKGVGVGLRPRLCADKFFHTIRTQFLYGPGFVDGCIVVLRQKRGLPKLLLQRRKPAVSHPNVLGWKRWTESRVISQKETANECLFTSTIAIWILGVRCKNWCHRNKRDSCQLKLQSVKKTMQESWFKYDMYVSCTNVRNRSVWNNHRAMGAMRRLIS